MKETPSVGITYQILVLFVVFLLGILRVPLAESSCFPQPLAEFGSCDAIASSLDLPFLLNKKRDSVNWFLSLCSAAQRAFKITSKQDTKNDFFISNNIKQRSHSRPKLVLFRHKQHNRDTNAIRDKFFFFF